MTTGLFGDYIYSHEHPPGSIGLICFHVLTSASWLKCFCIFFFNFYTNEVQVIFLLTDSRCPLDELKNSG